MIVDSHCHLDRLDLSAYKQQGLSGAIDAARERGVSRMLCIGIDMNNARAVIDIARRFEGVYASVGVHPSDLTDGLACEQTLTAYANHPEVVAIGETGLDYYYGKDNAALQRQSFQQHLQLAASVKKPVVVHTRDAREDTIALIREFGDPQLGGVLHCFTESWEMAKQALDLNYFISFSGIITFKNAQELREVVRRVPLERMLVETDSPYLAPVPYRGKKNEPKYVVEVAQCVAQIKGVDIEVVSQVTSANFDRLFLQQQALEV